MKNKIYKILSILSLIGFSLYWLLSILWSLPGFQYKPSIQKKIYFPKVLFVSGWKLFTPPTTNDLRLYYILRSVKKKSIADTMELLENIAIQKQYKAPFYQKQLIIDYLVNKNVVHLYRAAWVIDKKSDTDSSTILAPDKLTKSVAMSENINYTKMYLSSLLNYGLVVLKERNINVNGKEVKIVIKQKIMTPFKEMDNTDFVRTQTTVFESPYIQLQ